MSVFRFIAASRGSGSIVHDNLPTRPQITGDQWEIPLDGTTFLYLPTSNFLSVRIECHESPSSSSPTLDLELTSRGGSPSSGPAFDPSDRPRVGS